MPSSIFNSPEYHDLMQQHLRQVIELLFKEDTDFRIICNTQFVDFMPRLPDHITERFDDIIMFDIAEYSFESASIEDDTLIFEAGFGEENIGTTVSIPLLAIAQIFIDETYPPLAINFIKPAPKQKISQTQNSMEALLKNPKNQSLLKKKGKL